MLTSTTPSCKGPHMRQMLLSSLSTPKPPTTPPAHYPIHPLPHLHTTPPTHCLTHTLPHPHITPTAHYPIHPLPHLHTTPPTHCLTRTLLHPPIAPLAHYPTHPLSTRQVYWQHSRNVELMYSLTRGSHSNYRWNLDYIGLPKNILWASTSE